MAAGERHRGDVLTLYLQELCSHEPLQPTRHRKSSGGGAGEAAAPIATLALCVRPAMSARQQQGGGLLAQLGGGGGGGRAGPAEGAPAAWLECSTEVSWSGGRVGGRKRPDCNDPFALVSFFPPPPPPVPLCFAAWRRRARCWSICRGTARGTAAPCPPWYWRRRWPR